MRLLSTFLLLSLMLFNAGCDKGLAPDALSGDSLGTGVSGSVVFQNWPDADSLVDLRIVAFKSFPPDDIFLEVLAGEAFVYPGISDTVRLPLFVDRLDYVLELPAGNYGYLVVAQQFGDDLLTDWRAVGQYDVDTDSLPTPFTIVEGILLDNIFISVDFDNLPIQPF